MLSDFHAKLIPVLEDFTILYDQILDSPNTDQQATAAMVSLLHMKHRETVPAVRQLIAAAIREYSYARRCEAGPPRFARSVSFREGWFRMKIGEYRANRRDIIFSIEGGIMAWTDTGIMLTNHERAKMCSIYKRDCVDILHGLPPHLGLSVEVK